MSNPWYAAGMSPGAGCGSAGPLEPADKGQAGRAVIWLYAFDLDLAVEPSDGTNALAPVDLARADSVPPGLLRAAIMAGKGQPPSNESIPSRHWKPNAPSPFNGALCGLQ